VLSLNIFEALTLKQIDLCKLLTALTVQVALISNARRPEFCATHNIDRDHVMLTSTIGAHESNLV
jgi:hypothetical protein